MKRSNFIKLALAVCAIAMYVYVLAPLAYQRFQVWEIEKAIQTGDFPKAFSAMSKYCATGRLEFRVLRAALSSTPYQQYLLDRRCSPASGEAPLWQDVILLQGISSGNIDADEVLIRLPNVRDYAKSHLFGDAQLNELRRIDDIERMAQKVKDELNALYK